MINSFAKNLNVYIREKEMSNKIDNEKTCKNCRYYSQHYSKQGIRYGIVHCGHCLNGNHNNRIKKSLFEACEYWNDVAVKKRKEKNPSKKP
jgi:hypothetical protein